MMQLHKNRAAEGHDLLGLETSERAKARVLLEMLREARAEIRRGVNPALLESIHSLRQRIDAKTDYEIRLLSGRPTKEEAARVKKEIDDLLNQLQEAEARIRLASPRYGALMQPEPLSAREIQQQVVDPDTLLLEYALGEERSYLWAVTPTSVFSFELPKRADIESVVREVYKFLTAKNLRIQGETPEQRRARLRRAEGRYPAAAAALGRMLLGPVGSLLGEKRLLIVADGVLNYVPFAALPAAADGRPLVANHEIINLPSASTLAVLRRETAGRSPAPKTVAVLADPVFDNSDSRIRGRQRAQIQMARSNRVPAGDLVSDSELERSAVEIGLMTEEFGLPRLPFTRQEAEVIISLTRSEDSMKALDFDASVQKAVSGELAGYRIVHFATHGLLNTAHPELSGLVLSLFDRQGKSQNGFLKLQDVYNLNLPTDLVVLSACQTGLGREIKGEGLVGLTRGFMYAGARNVVASLWKVNDVATAELMGHFYSALLTDGMQPAAALRSAQLTLWRQNRWASPYYWAPFTIQGDWK
jgi:CHAT domain-containing protein